ncbi:MAG TPA: ATP-binding protein, partial [Candidatus Acidoferrum sp.]|nr:ATP-binding protein [Candidatus Acidoferrum sp.]
ELLSLVREALSNATRHAGARRIDVQLAITADRIELVIADDGVGFDLGRARGKGHHGLVNMGVRATAIGGRLDIDTKPGAGTRVRVSLPARGTR